MIRNAYLALLCLFLAVVSATAQTNPGFVDGQILGASQLNSAFMGKTDYPLINLSAGYVPFINNGGHCDGINDDSVALQSLINSLTNGGIILIPSTRCALANTVNINTNGIKIIGLSGPQGRHVAGAITTNSSFIWTGAAGGTMFNVSTPTAATSKVINGIAIENVSLYGNSLAATCLQIKSVGASSFKNLYIQNCTTVGLELGSVAGPTETHSNCRNIFENITTDQVSVAGIGIKLEGDATVPPGDVCLSTFINTNIFMNNAVGLQIDWADNNTFIQTFVFHTPLGTADAILLNGLSASEYAQGNHFYGLTISGDDASGGNLHAAQFSNNTVVNYDSFNHSPVPIIDVGAVLNYQFDVSPYFIEKFPYIAGKWYTGMYGGNNTVAGAAAPINQIVCVPGVVPRVMTVSKLGAVVTTAAVGNAQFAIYANNPAANAPGRLIIATGNVSTNVVAPIEVSGAVTANTQIGPGTNAGADLWFCENNDTGTVVFQAWATASPQAQSLFPTGNLLFTLQTPLTSIKCAACLGAGSTNFGLWPNLTAAVGSFGLLTDTAHAIVAFQPISVP